VRRLNEMIAPVFSPSVCGVIACSTLLALCHSTIALMKLITFTQVQSSARGNGSRSRPVNCESKSQLNPEIHT